MDTSPSLDAILKKFSGGMPALPTTAEVKPPVQTPGNVAPVTTQNGMAGVMDAFKAAGGMTPQEYSGQANTIIQQLKDANAPAIKGIESNIQKRDAIMSSSLPRPAPPQLQGMPQAPDTRMKDPINVFQSSSAILAMLGSLFTRRPLVTAMNAASAAMKGYAEGDKDAAERAHNSWKDSLQAAVAQNQAEMDQYNVLLSDVGLQQSERNAQLTALAASNNDQNMLAALKSGAPDAAFKILDGRQKSAESLTQLLVQAQQHDDAMKMEQQRVTLEQEQRAETERHNRAMEGDLSGNEGIVNAIANYQMPPLSSQAMRSPAGRAIMAAVIAQNPDYQAQRYQTIQTALRTFTSGKQGDTIRSMNVAISHLNTIDELGKALDNGDVQAINEAKQKFQEETGNTAPTNFDAAKSIVGDEIIKSVVGGGAGALADRDNAQNQLSRANSWKQLMGVTATYRKLLAGQLKGIERQYQSATGLKNFNDFLDPTTIQELEGDSGGSSAHAYTATMPDKRAIHSDDGQSWFYDDDGSAVP